MSSTTNGVLFNRFSAGGADDATRPLIFFRENLVSLTADMVKWESYLNEFVSYTAALFTEL